ncbi:hypothetical protein DENSPDRAFT_628293 [Dentipellis sp. KUC8613]|nr:hypothetical protein DENSPDRAFT_628293 [Dentipellis sp. KUC8613]
MIVISICYFSTVMTIERCRHWMLFLPLGMTMMFTLFPSIIMLIRVYALYNRNKLVLIGLGTMIVGQTMAGIWQVTVPGAAPAQVPIKNHEFEFHLCVYTPSPRLQKASGVYICISLGYDSIVFFLTLGRTLYMFQKHQGRGPRSRSIVNNLIRDGGLYFASIFSINFIWAIMIFYGPEGLKDLAAIPSSCITAVMISRVTLNLRIIVYKTVSEDEDSTATSNDIQMSQLRSLRSPRVAVPIGRPRS